MLPSFEIAWVISGCVETNMYAGLVTPMNSVDGINIANAIEQFCKTKSVNNNYKGVFIWADNYPFVAHANCVIQKLFETDAKLEGNEEGDKILIQADTPLIGTFRKNHPITTGIINLYEGITISHPNKNIIGLKVIATSTEDHPVILCSESNNKRGRVVVDCGYTKLHTEWNTAGTGRYVSNATCWLTGLNFL